MFDDVMFLAKGGYTVYLGPVNEVESYFEGLGLVVPERINPPDYYMDALEGAVQQGVTGPNNIDPKSLPVLWMMHKGYKIPKELLKVAAAIETPAAKKKILETESARFMSTFAQEAWQEIYQKVVVSWDEIKTSLLKVRDLSGRQTPGFFVQMTIILHRSALSPINHISYLPFCVKYKADLSYMHLKILILQVTPISPINVVYYLELYLFTERIIFYQVIYIMSLDVHTILNFVFSC